MRSHARTLMVMTTGVPPGFIDPRPALEKEFMTARARLHETHGPSTSLLGALRLFIAERRLHYEMVTKPLRSARW